MRLARSIDDDRPAAGGARYLGVVVVLGRVARELAPDTVVVSSQAAHYTHGRMSHLLGMTHETIPQDRLGKMDLHALEARLEGGGVGTIVATLGTTSLGALDPVDEIVTMVWTRRTAGSTRF